MAEAKTRPEDPFEKLQKLFKPKPEEKESKAKK
jgi:hypothetical protein